MQHSNIDEYAVSNSQEEAAFEEEGIDSVIGSDDNGEKTPGKNRNVRKSIEQFLERQRLRHEVSDFDLYEEH